MTPEIARNSVEVGSIPVHYLEAGIGTDVLFLHGAGGAPPAGASFVAMLAARHRVLLPSRPGFDETPAGDCRSFIDVAEVMAEFVRKTAAGPIHVVAQSAGGTIGCWLAVLHPELVESLVLSAPAAFAVRPPDMAKGPLPAEELEERLYGDQPSWTEPPTDEERKRIARNAAFYAKTAHVSGGNRDLLERLSQIQAPTLLLVTTHERMFLPESMTPYQERIPDCHRIFIYGAAHEMPISAAPRWVALVSDFVDRGETFVVNKGSRDSG